MESSEGGESDEDGCVCCDVCKTFVEHFLMVKMRDDPVTGSISHCYKCRALELWKNCSEEEQQNRSLEKITEEYLMRLMKKDVEKEKDRLPKGS